MFLLGTFVNNLFVVCKVNVTSDSEQGTNDEQNSGPKGFAAALLIGILIAVIGAAMGPLTGGRDNPYFWVPIAGPILGAQLGAAMYVKLLAPCLPANRVLKAEDNTSKVKATAQL